MSSLRPELRTNVVNTFTPTNGTAYLMVLNAVKQKRGLVHGRLHFNGESCAIGSFFDTNPKLALHETFIDEVAAVNDSAPQLTTRARKTMVLRWLRWKLRQAGMPGFAKAVKP